MKDLRSALKHPLDGEIVRLKGFYSVELEENQPESWMVALLVQGKAGTWSVKCIESSDNTLWSRGVKYDVLNTDKEGRTFLTWKEYEVIPKEERAKYERILLVEAL